MLKPCFSARAPWYARLRLSSTSALMSAGRCSPEPSRECSSRFLTMESARLPCCTTLSRLSFNVPVSSSIPSRTSPGRATGLSTSFNSSVNSDESAAKFHEVERVLDLVRDASGQLAERGHLLCMDKAHLRGLQIAQRRFSSVSRRANCLLGALALCNIRIDQHKAAAWHRIATHLDNAAIRPRALEAQLSPRVLVCAAEVSFQIGRVFAAISKITEVLGKARSPRQKSI